MFQAQRNARNSIALVAISAIGLSVSPTLAGEFEHHRVELFKWIPREDFSETWALVKGCWGYVSESGREYGMACHTLGTTFFEVTDPVNTVEVGFIDAPDSDWREIKTYQHYAYIVGESGPGIQVVDLAQIDKGIVTLVNEITEGGNPPTHTVEINEASGYLYRCAGGSGFPTYGLRIYDLADPTAPDFVAEWNNRYVHDAQIVTYPDGPYAGREIAFCCAVDTVSGGNPALDIVDVTDKSNIFLVTSKQYPKGFYAHQGWLSPDWRYFYLNDELDEQENNIPCTSRIFDVSVLESPFLVTAFHTGTPSTDHNMYTLGRFLYESNYTCGLRVFDTTDPVRPVQIAYFDTRPEDNVAGLIASYSNYPYLPSGIVIGTDRERGFFVWDVSAVADCDGNGLDDGEEIAADPLLDTDENRVLDICQSTLHVPSDYATIQAALDAAHMSDLILVADGTYTGAGNTNLNFQGKVLTLRSENGAASTILDGGGTSRVLFFDEGESFGTKVSGFTITGGSASTGAGIYCLNSGPVIEHCLITGNASTSSGAAVYSDNSYPTLRDCLITENTSAATGGVLFARGDSKPTFTHCTISANMAGTNGGAIYALRSYPVIRDCILWGNIALNGPELAAISLGVISVDFSDVAGGQAGVYLLNGTLDWGDGNLDADPLFISGPQGDHYLSQTAAGQAEDSPCVDAGSAPAEEVNMDGRTTRTDELPDTAMVDMGYHYPTLLAPTSCEGDANADDIVDPLDSGYVLSRLGCSVGTGDPACDAADVNANGIVDPLDVGYVLSRFGTCS